MRETAPPPPNAARPAPADGDSVPPLALALLAGLTLFWGANWPAMKLVVTELDPWTFRVISLFFGGFGLLAISRLGGNRLTVPRAEWAPLALCALFNVTGWHLFSAFGVMAIEAGRAAILAFTMPLWASLLAIPLLGERLNGRRMAALALGLAGISLLIVPEFDSLRQAVTGPLLMVGAAFCWALGTVLMKRFAWTIGPLRLAGWQLTLGGLPVLLGMLAWGDPGTVWQLSATALWALAFVLALPMLFCHYAWFKTVSLLPAGVAAIGTLAIPVVGVLSSALILGERIGGLEVAALLLVLSALALVLLGGRRWQQRRAGG